ncbi:hypothetical protein FIE12Z_10993 [Fusarium flagelliforme]|uniref:Uncharacterized protein n=1 Tax=Fusarium flagelliforme TaxID=2675880 RepID=A0A395MCH5_9HYPO|nr:hypothetical protein FIE12Z_10993 [Fusarium flagelliforme]
MIWKAPIEFYGIVSKARVYSWHYERVVAPAVLKTSLHHIRETASVKRRVTAIFEWEAKKAERTATPAVSASVEARMAEMRAIKAEKKKEDDDNEDTKTV